MYAKLIIAICIVGVVHAGGLIGAAPLAYGHGISSGLSYAPALTSYTAPALVSKTIAPATSYSSYATTTSHGSPVVAAAPLALSHAPTVSYAAPAVSVAHSVAPAVSYASPAISLGHSIAPAISYAPALSYAAAPAIAHGIPAIGRIGYGTHGGW